MQFSKKIYKKFKVWVKGSKNDQNLKILPYFFFKFEFPINFGLLNPTNIFLIFICKSTVFLKDFGIKNVKIGSKFSTVFFFAKLYSCSRN